MSQYPSMLPPLESMLCPKKLCVRMNGRRAARMQKNHVPCIAEQTPAHHVQHARHTFPGVYRVKDDAFVLGKRTNRGNARLRRTTIAVAYIFVIDGDISITDDACRDGRDFADHTGDGTHAIFEPVPGSTYRNAHDLRAGVAEISQSRQQSRLGAATTRCREDVAGTNAHLVPLGDQFAGRIDVAEAADAVRCAGRNVCRDAYLPAVRSAMTFSASGPRPVFGEVEYAPPSTHPSDSCHWPLSCSSISGTGLDRMT